MDRFRELEVFVAVAETGGFAKAAARLKSSPPTVTRVVAGLEWRLGVPLFTRTTRTVAITEAGRSYLERPPRTPADLKAHSIIAFSGLVPRNELRFGPGRSTNRISLAPRFEINDAPAAIDAVEQGEGIMPAISYMVAEQLRKGRLISVLDKFAPPPVPVQLV